MKQFLSLLLCLLATSALQAQRSDTEASLQASRLEASKPIKQKGIKARKSNLQAQQLDAALGSSQSQYFYGLQLLQQAVTQMDSSQALYWLIRAADGGSAAALHQLGVFYKYGLLVEYDLARALQYFDQSAQLGYTHALYSRGFMRYKGLGCEQNYPAAAADFQDGSSAKDPMSMYMLGLCYRNGFGVPRDPVQGDYWLQQAAEAGVMAAESELRRAQSEIETGARQLAEKSKGATQLMRFAEQLQANTFNRITDLASALNETYYTGYWVKYDWSGEHIVEAVPIRLICHGSATDLTGRLTFEGRDIDYVFSGVVDNNNTLVARRLTLKRHDRYIQSDDDNLGINSIELGLYAENTDELLIGQVRGFSSFEQEPERPIRLLLHAVPEPQSASHKIEALLTPNPTDGPCNIRIDLEQDDTCQIMVFDVNGRLVHEGTTVHLAKGSYLYPLAVELAAGTYFISMKFTQEFKTLRLIKI